MSFDSVNAAQELAELVETPPEGIKVELVNEADLYDWKVYLNGPESSPFHVRPCDLPLIRLISHPTNGNRTARS